MAWDRIWCLSGSGMQFHVLALRHWQTEQPGTLAQTIGQSPFADQSGGSFAIGLSVFSMNLLVVAATRRSRTLDRSEVSINQHQASKFLRAIPCDLTPTSKSKLIIASPLKQQGYETSFPALWRFVLNIFCQPSGYGDMQYGKVRNRIEQCPSSISQPPHLQPCALSYEA